jgi:FkbM family methyltransferase
MQMPSANPPSSLGVRLLRVLAGSLPERAYRAASKYYFFKQIKAHRFQSTEIEWTHLTDWLQPGDWCIDVGGNVGRYALRMSELVGDSGHVVVFEPLTRSFDLLTHFVEKGHYRNITLINAAATDRPRLIAISPNSTPHSIPYIFDTNTGTRIGGVCQANGERKLALTIDSLGLTERIKLIKIDVEGHELAVCKGMTGILQRDHPFLVIEDHRIDTGVTEFLAQFGYDAHRLSETSRNLMFTGRAGQPMRSANPNAHR